MAHNRYVSIDYISASGVSPRFDIALPQGVWERAVAQQPDLPDRLEHLTELGLAFLKQPKRPATDAEMELAQARAQDADHLNLWPGRLHAVEVVGRDERRFAAIALNEVTGALVADAPHATEQPYALRLKEFGSDGTANGFTIAADIVLPRDVTDPMLRRQAVTAMAEVSIAYGMPLDPSNKPSVVVDTGRDSLSDSLPEVTFSPRPLASLTGKPLPHAPNVWHLTSEGLNNDGDPLVVLAGLVAVTSVRADGGLRPALPDTTI